MESWQGQAELHALFAPYKSLERTADVSFLESRELPPGTILVVRTSASESSWGALHEAVEHLRVRIPSAPVVWWVAEEDGDKIMARRPRGLRIRGMIVGDHPDFQSLRRQLTDSAGLADGVLRWLEDRGRDLKPEARELIRYTLNNAPAHATVSSLAESARQTSRNWRRRFQHHRLESPLRWFRLARGLHSAVRLQQDPTTTLAVVAFDLDYHDASTFSRQFSQLFGCRPTVARRALGWEWLLDRWYHKRKSSSRRGPASPSRSRSSDRAPSALPDR